MVKKTAKKATTLKELGESRSVGASDAKYPLTAVLRNLARHHGRKAVADAYKEFSSKRGS